MQSSKIDTTRRDVIKALGALIWLRQLPQRVHGQSLRVALWQPTSVPSRERDDARASLARGVQLGVEEGAKTTSLFGGGAVSMVQGAELADLARTAKAHVLLGGIDPSECEHASAFAESHHLLYMNAACRESALREEGCHRMTFHVAPNEGDAHRVSTAKDTSAALVWDPSLEAFGAAQLNERFRQRFPGAEMDGVAWGGWFAVKVVTEAALRTGEVAPEAIARWLERTTSRFDGHKGTPLIFSRGTHQLTQPLYRAEDREGGRRVVPIKAPGDTLKGVQRGDSLGERSTAKACTHGDR